jgi:hypothetical protein
MTSQAKVRLTPEEYVAIERQATYKSEYVNGEMFAMSDASPCHVLIVTNVVAELRRQLKPHPCTVYSTDLRVQVGPTGLYTSPDVIVVCDQPRGVAVAVCLAVAILCGGPVLGCSAVGLGGPSYTGGDVCRPHGVGAHPDAFYARARCEAVGWKA